jgi:hypothetical protein
MPCVREHRSTFATQAAGMIRMSVSDDDEVDIVRCDALRLQSADQLMPFAFNRRGRSP